MRSNLLSVVRKVQSSGQNAGILQVTTIAATSSNASYSSVADMVHNLRMKYAPNSVNPRDLMGDSKWNKMFCIEGNLSAGKAAFTEEFAAQLGLKHYVQCCTNYDLLRLIELQTEPEGKAEWNMDPRSYEQRVRDLSLDRLLTDPTADIGHTSRYVVKMLDQSKYQWNDATFHILSTGQGTAMNRHFFSQPVFGEAMKRMGWINSGIKEFYDRSYDRHNEYTLPPQVVIYLDVPAEECYERIQAGDNEAEKKLPLEYLQRIEDVYKTVYIPKARDDGVNVIEIDWSNPLSVDEVIDDLDNMASLQAGYSKWDVYWQQLITIRSKSNNEEFFGELPTGGPGAGIYNPNEEMWNLDHVDSLNELKDEEKRKFPQWQYRKGLNEAGGDKWIWLKG